MAKIGNTDDLKDKTLIVISCRSLLLGGTIVVAVAMAMSAVVSAWVAGWVCKRAVPQTPAEAQVAVQPANPPLQAASAPSTSAALVSPAPQGQVFTSAHPASGASASLGTVSQNAGSATNVALKLWASRGSIQLGESFNLSVEVAGADRGIDMPDLSVLPQSEVVFLGQHSNSRSSITIINGRMTRETFEGRVFSYKITPKAQGTWFTGPLRVTAAGKTYTHPGVTVQVTKAPSP